MRLNLQLFAYTGSSIVDYLKSVGKDSSYNARAQLAKQHGITNYSGTAAQNTQLLNTLRNGSNTTNKTTTNNSTNTSNNTSDSAMKPITNNAPSQSSTPNAPKLNGVDQATMDKMNKEFQTSQAYQEAMAQTQALLDKITAGKTTYSDQIDSLIKQIQNRDKFEYDVDSDTMFQQYLSSMMADGKTAMQDTMGQAAALTGGYGSTYATSAANQAYNQYIQDAYNNLPEYYEMALNAYQMEGEEMFKELDMLNQADQNEYQRMYNSWQASADTTSQMYSQEYQKWADEVANATNLAQMQNSDWWSQTNYDESVRQFEKNYAESQRQFNENMAMQKSQFEQEMAFQREQFNWQKSKAASGGSGGSSGSKKSTSSSSNLKTPSETQMKKALEAYNEGGQAALDKYVDSLPSNIDMTSIDSYVGQYGTLPVSQRTYTVIDDGGVNWFWGVDNNAKVKDQYGNEMTLGDLKKTDEDLAKELSKLGKGKSYTKK